MRTAKRLVGILLSTATLAVSATARAAAGEAAESGWPGPLLVSPGGEGREGAVGGGCPTFSWALVSGAAAYEVVVYAVSATGDAGRPAAEPVLHRQVPAGATSWTPELGECLPPGRYSWAVGALVNAADGGEDRRWSKPAVFRVEGAAPGEAPGRPGAAVVVAAPPVHFAAGAAAPSGSSPRSASGALLFTPPGCSGGGEMFTDVPATSPFCKWIEQLARDGVSEGCGGGKFCPDLPVTRGQLALLLERSMRGTLRWAPAPSAPRVTSLTDPEDTVAFDTSIAVGADGLPIISYRNATADTLEVLHCEDAACTAATKAIVDNLTTVNQSGSIAIGADGLPVISYFDVTAQALKVAHCDDVACTGATKTPVDDTVDIVGTYSSIAIGADGLPIISYRDQNAGALKVAHCDDMACTGQNETITTVDDPLDGNDVGTYTSIAIGADGLPVISYYDFTAKVLKVAHCDDAACAGQNETITTVDDPANSVGEYTSIAIGADGLPVISYFDATAQTLKVAHCDDVACTGATKTKLDDPPVATNFVGEYTSIAIGTDGLAVISYRDKTQFALKVAHCNDVACTGAMKASLNEPNDAAYTSIAIGADGVPVIAYVGGSGGGSAVKVARCGTLSCT